MSRSRPVSPTPCRVAGSLAVLAGLANVVADSLLRGGPAPVRGAAITLKAPGPVPFELVYAGSVPGAAVIPFRLRGLWPVYRALPPAGRPVPGTSIRTEVFLLAGAVTWNLDAEGGAQGEPS